jgi:tetratricopeptide (TPR) repeat protein
MKDSGISTHRLAIAIGVAAVAASAVVGGLGMSDAVPAPFYWRDVGLVCFLCALPLSASIAAVVVSKRLPKHAPAMLLLEAIALLAVPSLYIHARTRDAAVRAIGLMEQSRLGEARLLLHRLVMLAPSAQWKGYPLHRAAIELDAAVQSLSERVAAPLTTNAMDEDRLGRARDLAMLGRTSEAIRVLESSQPLLKSGEACNLHGTIDEALGQWSSACRWYNQAREAWRPLADSAERTAGLVRAATGLGYCQRKLGHLPEAEAAYQEVLALSPTARSHFLLAQFYEDTQQAMKAEAHARQAMALDPPHFLADGHKLIDKLMTLHFGCWGVATTDNHAASQARIPAKP